AAGPYAQAALVPATPWLDATAPGAPTLRREGESAITAAGPGKPAAVYAIWRRQGKHWRFAVQPAGETAISLAADPAFGAVDKLVVSAVDYLGNESPRVTLALDAVPRWSAWSPTRSQSPPPLHAQPASIAR
ncbi:MAG: hypothetical protein H7343_15105, partial [Undibacterium sp.]|nr:hypothetical protein [Opitutaceae bacterium]